MFELFDVSKHKRCRRSKLGSMISISKFYAIAFSRKFCLTHEVITTYNFAQLFFDPEMRRIGIRLEKEQSQTNNAIFKRALSFVSLRQSRSFFSNYDIKITKLLRFFDPPLDNNIFILQLPDNT